MMKRAMMFGLGLSVLVASVVGMAKLMTVRMGKQPDGGFIVSSGQRVEGGAIAFNSRPIDLALHPTGTFYAVLSKTTVFLGDANGVRENSSLPLGANAGFHGLVWSPDGKRLFASTEKGHIAVFRLNGAILVSEPSIVIKPTGDIGNPVPGGMAITRDGKTLFVASANRNAIVEIDLTNNIRVREYPVQNIPYELRLSEDERTLIVSNWGGRLPQPGELTAKSERLDILIDGRNVPVSGTVSLIDRESSATRHVEVGIHPTSIIVKGNNAYVANAMSDTISEIDIKAGSVTRTISLLWEKMRIFGAMPNALAIQGDTLYAADGGDNAIAEIDLKRGHVRGFRHAGYFPTAIALGRDGKSAFVLNTKGNGSVSQTSLGKPGNAHDFQGTVRVVDLSANLDQATALVARDNRWNAEVVRPTLPVYNGAIKHVLYIIKENRTYDEVFGDLPQGNGAPALASLGGKVMPNHQKLAKQFTLFDNGYVSGTNSADGHAWSTQSIANDYLEHFYVGYSRTYPCEGEDPMAISKGGALWDAALAKKRSLRVYGEFCDETKASFDPVPKDWFEVWNDRKAGTNKFKMTAATVIESLKPYIHPEIHYWPLLQSDQFRADKFIEEYKRFSKEDKVPNLMVMSLPCDHGEGTNPKYPTPRAMMADNDLALGRVVEAISKSPQWKETCIFVIEDDAQSGPDHVDGHRTVFMAISPYTRRAHVDSTFYTTCNMLRSIELMLDLEPMTRFDLLADPLVDCFQDQPDLTPYQATANIIPLDERNPSGRAMTDTDRFWLAKTLELDWSHIDGPDPYWLNRINWYSFHKGTIPYPSRPNEQPGMVDDDDDGS
jgi:DNA-binding beta-propeller fold protein YncE